MKNSKNNGDDIRKLLEKFHKKLVFFILLPEFSISLISKTTNTRYNYIFLNY
jgi:hypothetical protein